MFVGSKPVKGELVIFQLAWAVWLSVLAFPTVCCVIVAVIPPLTENVPL
jgi:hypothetical protein